MALRTRTALESANRDTPDDRGRLSGRALIGSLALVALLLPLLSSILSLYDRVTHWGKLVHGVEGGLMALLIGLLLLGWRDRARIDLSDELAILTTMCAGVLFGVLWELIEFVLDWSRYSDVQKSNSDTMTDFLWNDLAVVVGALLAARLYCHVLSPRERADVGSLAAWLADGPSRFLDRHGFLTAIVVSLMVALAVASIWYASRPLPGFGIS